MKRNLTLVLVVGVIFTALLAITASGAAAGQADPDIVVILRGAGPGVDPLDPRIAGVPANNGCYETDLFDAKTNRIIGTGIDCLEVIDGDDTDGDTVFPSIGDSFLVDRTTIFFFPQGTLVARGNTTVVPTIFPNPGGSSPLYTHVVGDVNELTDNIAAGCGTATSGCTGSFADAKGDVRLSGIVDMTDLLNGVSNVGFNCIFVIDLD